ncbi:MAG: sigma-70 family RNA polymerase sigma factor [Candidatus Aminicenantes bacterium]|nr:MAG: sigma-70 family RNA polymerase sigma factor [Candidatus Aminicenantes bacterium]
MVNPMDINFGNLSDREIAESLYKAYGVNLVRYAIKSWQQDEDDAWEILYDTLYGFINSYSAQTFDSEQQVGALVWKIFRNKLRDKLRKKKRQGNFLSDELDSLEAILLESSASCDVHTDENPILSELDSVLEELNDWERQLLLCRANDFPYKVIEELTGRKKDFLKVHYQRLKKRISEKLEGNPNFKEGEGK